MSVVAVSLIFLTVLGHWSFCLWASNSINALGWRRAPTKLCSKPVDWLLTFGTLAFLGWWWQSGALFSGMDGWRMLPAWLLTYAAFCCFVAVTFLPRWLWQQLFTRPPAALLSNHTATYDLRPRFASRHAPSGLGKVYLKLPGNQSLMLAVHEKTVELPRLPPALDGLSVAHLSDLHFTGRVSKAYFEEVVNRTNELDADIIALTGDLVDKADCIDWIPDTLARLRARHGVYFILGNHDLRVDHTRLRKLLTDAGAIDMSGRWLTRKIRGHQVVLAGNELPWIGPAADMTSCPSEPTGERMFRVLLSHTPDQIEWARQRDFDLMLAGHTHGGQIRFPLIGPIVAPSLYGVRYAAGTFDLPPTLMHVSRGISGLQPIRWNCPPELAKLILKMPPSC